MVELGHRERFVRCPLRLAISADHVVALSCAATESMLALRLNGTRTMSIANAPLPYGSSAIANPCAEPARNNGFMCSGRFMNGTNCACRRRP